MSLTVRRKLSWLIAVLALLLTMVCSASAQRPDVCKSRQVSFVRGKSSVVLRGRLEPCKQRVYKLHARRGQRMSVLLLPEENDLVFWVRATRPAPGGGSLVLEGIHRNGVTDWSGELPFSGEYEIHVSRPPVSDRSDRRVLPYRIEVSIGEAGVYR